MFTASIEGVAGHSGEARSRARRRYWIMPQVQGRFIAWMVVSSAVIATAVAWIVLLLVWAPLHNKVAWLESGVDADVFFAQTMGRVFLTTALMIVFFGALSFLLGLLISHRVAGPLFRLGRAAGRASDAKYGERVTLRERDYIHDFARKFNRMMERFEEEHVAHQEALAGVETQLAAIAEDLRSGQAADEEIRQRIETGLDILRSVSPQERRKADDA